MGNRSPAILYGSLVLAGLVLALHGVVLWLAPFASNYPMWPAMLVLVSFFGICSTSAWLLVILRTPGESLDTRHESHTLLAQVLGDSRLRVFLVLCALVGICLHMWAKYYLTELRPISCISEIRFAWLEVDRQLLPTHIRVASVLGHLLTSFAYMGLFATSFGIGFAKSVKAVRSADLLFQLFFIVIGVLYAGFIGSRNAMLALLIMCSTGLLLGLASRIHQRGAKQTWKLILMGLSVPLLSALLFSSVIFSDRLFCRLPDALVKLEGVDVSARKISDFSMTGNYKEFDLIAREVDSAVDWRQALFVDRCAICRPTMVYLSHGIFNLSKVMATEERGPPVLLVFFTSLPKRLGLSDPVAVDSTAKRVYGPGGVSLAGAAYHDFGAAGVVLSALVIGLLFGQSILWMQGVGISVLVGAWLFAGLFYTLLISNMFVGFSVLPFPFILFGVGGGFIARLLMRGKNCSKKFIGLG
jgi:hypothetical protein